MIMKIHFGNRNWVFFYNQSLFSFYSLWKSGKQAIFLVKHKYELLLAWERQVFYILFRMAFCISDFYIAIFQNVLVKNAYFSCFSLPPILFKWRMFNIDTFKLYYNEANVFHSSALYNLYANHRSDLCIAWMSVHVS